MTSKESELKSLPTNASYFQLGKEFLSKLEKAGDLCDATEFGGPNFKVLSSAISEAGKILSANGWNTNKVEKLLSLAIDQLRNEHEAFIDSWNTDNKEPRGRPIDNEWPEEREHQFYLSIVHDVNKGQNANAVIGKQCEKWGAISAKQIDSLKNRFYRLHKKYTDCAAFFENLSEL
jgi:hypothetical protein